MSKQIKEIDQENEIRIKYYSALSHMLSARDDFMRLQELLPGDKQQLALECAQRASQLHIIAETLTLLDVPDYLKLK